MTDVTIGVGNTEIGTYSFYDCTSLENVSIAEDSEDDRSIVSMHVEIVVLLQKKEKCCTS